jgi:hypothetical protein
MSDPFDTFDPFSIPADPPHSPQNTNINNTNSSTGASIAWSGSNNSWPFAVGTASTNSSVTFGLPAKYKVQYIIELTDGQTLQLKEQPFITPREMIGLCKLINMVSIATQVGLKVMWSDLITELAIDRHFVSGSSRNSYTDADTQYVFLIDEM